MSFHPAYPSQADLSREAAAMTRDRTDLTTLRALHSIVSTALDRASKCDDLKHPDHRWGLADLDANRQLVAVPEEQRAIQMIAELHAQGLSPYKIAADLKKFGTPVSHVTIRKIIAGRTSDPLARTAATDPARVVPEPAPQAESLPWNAYRPPGQR
jgi:hypothetical protein